MEFEKAIKNSPLIYAPCDAVKFCYQAAYGAEHLLSADAKEYFDKEYRVAIPRDGEIAEQLSEDFYRVHLPVWKHKNLPSEWLWNMFYLTASVKHEGDISPLLETARKLASDGLFPFNCKDFNEYLRTYDGGAVHHSELCRKNALPSYRIIHRKYVKLIPILEKLHPCRVTAIDGRAAAGKTTLSETLADVTGASVIHTDDFFLPPSLRTEQRLSEAGGNIHYERFFDEVITALKENKDFSYNKFDCSSMTLNGKVHVKKADHYIVEGSYSHHPYFKDYADFKIFCNVSSDIQLGRIEKRNGIQMLEMFKDKWIPLEENYFKTFDIREKSDIVTQL